MTSQVSVDAPSRRGVPYANFNLNSMQQPDLQLKPLQEPCLLIGLWKVFVTGGGFTLRFWDCAAMGAW